MVTYKLAEYDKLALLEADCKLILPNLPPNSVDSVVTDPPYELTASKKGGNKETMGRGFMGKKWDGTGIAYDVDMWKSVLSVLKPGGHLLAFGGTRTHHRMMVAIEDAGFQIRDVLMWVFGSGFPKSLDIGKAIDKDNGKSANLRKFAKWFSRMAKDKTDKEIDSYLGLNSNGATASHYRCVDGKQPRFPRLEFYYKLKKWLNFGDEWDAVIIEAEREVAGKGTSGKTAIWNEQGEMGEFDITVPATDEAKQWDGWGTALKPAYEIIVLAMKPIEGTFANNVLKWGVGGINIDGCRIPTDGEVPKPNGRIRSKRGKFESVNDDGYDLIEPPEPNKLGRWPANLILSRPEDEYELRDDITPSQLRLLAEWVDANPE